MRFSNNYPRQYLFESIRGSPESHEVMVLGLRERVVGMTGNRLDKEKLAGILKEHCRLGGREEYAGVPLYDTLKSLGSDDLAQYEK